MDLVWLKGKTAFCIVDTHTHFSAAPFLKGKRAQNIWDAFIVCLASAYVGYLDRVRVDQETIFFKGV